MQAEENNPAVDAVRSVKKECLRWDTLFLQATVYSEAICLWKDCASIRSRLSTMSVNGFCMVKVTVVNTSRLTVAVGLP